MAKDTVIVAIATAAISGAVAVLVAGVGAVATSHVANIETSRKQLEYQLKRRSERQETYQTVIDLLSEFGWRVSFDKKYDVLKDFNLPFLRAANRVRVYGSPATVAAIDEIPCKWETGRRGTPNARLPEKQCPQHKTIWSSPHARTLDLARRMSKECPLPTGRRTSSRVGPWWGAGRVDPPRSPGD